ncbi:camp-dependent protein kinase catalytic subunit [Geranomyces variabilis]|nr:camp-dependent protein kinase catalytic subunit [Geranomyces variabilis]
MHETNVNLPQMAANAAAKSSVPPRKNSLHDKLGAFKGAFIKKLSAGNLANSDDSSLSDSGSLEDVTSKPSEALAGLPSLPQAQSAATTVTPLQSAAPRNNSLNRANSIGKGQLKVQTQGSAGASASPQQQKGQPLVERVSATARAGSLRPKSGLVKNKQIHGSMPMDSTPAFELRSVKSSAQIQGAITEDTGSAEALDQISELKLHSPSTPSFVNSSLDNSSESLGASAGTGVPNATAMGKHARSLPKISTLFTAGKKTRASSATPGCDSMISPVSPSVSTIPLTQATRKGTLSAYEIAPNSAPGLHRDYNLDDFHIIRRVGKGGFANVFLVRLKHSTGRYYALKAIKKHDVVKLKQDKQVMNEKNILRNISHPFIVELYHTFQNPTYLFMTMEYVAGGDLFSYLRKVSRFSEEAARFYTSEVLISLEYLHQNHIVYRDLKPENILLDTTGHIKLADFGFAKVVKKTTQSFCGTPDYIAAEIVANKPYGKAADWWSFGVLVFELISGKTPFGDESSDKIYDNIQLGKIKWHPLVKGAAKDLVKRLLDMDPEKRLGSQGDGGEIKNHAWYKLLIWQKVQARQTVPPFVPSVDPPEIIEKDRIARGVRPDEYMEALKSPVNAHGFFNVDPFVELFKEF